MEHVGYVDLTFNLKVTTSFFFNTVHPSQELLNKQNFQSPQQPTNNHKNRLFEFDL